MKKILCTLLAGVMLTSTLLSGCGSDKETTQSDTTTTAPAATGEPTPPEDLGPEDAKYDSITIGGVALSEFTIVYANDPVGSKKHRNPELYEVGETHYTKLIAEELADVLKNMTGVEVPTAATSSAATDHEILIGQTNRPQSTEAIKTVNEQTFSIGMSEGKLSIVGGSSAANYLALGKLYEYFAGQNSKDVTIPADYLNTGDAGVINVSCIGDSITDGYGSSDGSACPWPEVLQRILWKNCVVKNFGVSGTTMRTDHKDAYVTCWKYNSMIAAAPESDITLIMLGTNDSDRFKNWTDADTQKYTTDYTAFLDSLTALNPDVKFILMNCPEYYNGTGKDGEFGSDRMVNLQKTLFEQYKAEGRAVSFFDMHTFTKNDMGKAMFPDGLHPGDEGYAVMAQRIAQMLEAYMNDTEDALLIK